MIDYNVSHSALSPCRICKAPNPANAFEESWGMDCQRACWKILFEMFPLSAASLWQRDSDAAMYVVAHSGLPPQLSRLRLPKTDSAVGRAVMVKCIPHFVSDVQSRDSRRLRQLSPLELKGLRESGTRTVLFLPRQHQDKDYVLMLCFSEVMELQQETRDALWEFCKRFVDKYEILQSNSCNVAILQLEELLIPAGQVNRETMDKVAEIIRKTVHAGGVSIFLCSEDRKKLQLVGSSPGIEDNPPYEKVYYPLEHGQGLTPEVVMNNRVLRYPDLENNLVKEELLVRGYTWSKLWPEALDYASYKTYPFMAVPFGNRLGVIRASCREESECSFTAQDEETLREMADKLASFVNESQRDLKVMETKSSERR